MTIGNNSLIETILLCRWFNQINPLLKTLIILIFETFSVRMSQDNIKQIKWKNPIQPQWLFYFILFYFILLTSLRISIFNLLFSVFLFRIFSTFDDCTELLDSALAESNPLRLDSEINNVYFHPSYKFKDKDKQVRIWLFLFLWIDFCFHIFFVFFFLFYS